MKNKKQTIIIILLLIISLSLNLSDVSAETTLDCTNVLKKGAKGDNVKILQTELNQVMSCGLAVDGSFGSATESCVVKFQAKYKLDQDGKVGPKTCPKINEVYLETISNKEEETTLKLATTTTLKNGSNNSQVKILQQMLNKTTHCNLKVDGDFGDKTEWCVKKYQDEHNLGVDGKVGPATRNSLNSNAPIVKKVEFITITASDLNVRTDATTSSKKISTVTAEEVYQVLGTKTNSDGSMWYKIEYDPKNAPGKFGYISGRYTEKAQDFIFLDISEQNLKLYKGGKLILNVPVVTGDVSEKNDTPRGNYSIGYTNDYIKNGGRIHLSKYDSYVDYWMSFNGSYGFHDARWRNSEQLTDKTTYLTDGSHGCVNMFTQDAEFLYNNIYKDLAVTIVQKTYY